MNSVTAQRPVNTRSIVPGDRIATNRKEVIDYDSLISAVKKRYRGDVYTVFVHGVLGMNLDTMKDAVAEYVKQAIAHDGHDRNVILTEPELRERKISMDGEGIMNALIACLKNGATEFEIKRVVRQQVSLRKVRTEPDNMANALIRHLKYQGFVCIKGIGKATTFVLNASNVLDKDSYVAHYKAALRID